MFAWNAALRFALVIALVPLLSGGGCVVTVDPLDGNGGDGDGGDGTETVITIRIINATNTDLDPEIYISDQPVSKEELFTAANKYRAFGVFDSGVLGPLGTETFELDCSLVRVIGTTGGRFESETNPEQSDREFFLAQDSVFICGDRITFTYKETLTGFTTELDLD